MTSQLLLETDTSCATLAPAGEYLTEPSLSVIADHITDAIITIDVHSRVHYVNSATEKLFGYTKQELIGHELTMLMPERYQRSHMTALQEYARTGQRHVDWKVVMLPGQHKDGHAISLGISFGEYQVDGEHMFVGIARDIAGPSRLIEQLRQAKADAEATEQSLELSNKAKDRFLAVVSHELRSPLTPIMAALDALKSEELQPFVEIIQRNVELEVRLINDLLDLTRLSKGKFQLQLKTIDVHKLLREVVTTYREVLSSRGLSIDLSLTATRHYIQGDPARLDQVFWNLIQNSMKFTPKGGSIAIRTSDAEDRIVIEVSDTGIGIEPDLLKKIFEAFEQGNKVPGYLSGLGLGLTVSKELVEAHRGTIRAASEGNMRGATFTVELPTIAVASTRDTVTAKPNNLTGRPDTQKHTILLVDDQADTSATLGLLLTRRGYHVESARSISEAIESVKAMPFDLVISDIMLPDGTGIEMLPKLRAIRDVPALALSGLADEEDVRRSLEAGFHAHIAKPFNFQHLLDSIEQVVTERS
jgi:PAS domain S-box-containing protein